MSQCFHVIGQSPMPSSLYVEYCVCKVILELRYLQLTTRDLIISAQNTGIY